MRMIRKLYFSFSSMSLYKMKKKIRKKKLKSYHLSFVSVKKCEETTAPLIQKINFYFRLFSQVNKSLVFAVTYTFIIQILQK